MSEEGGFITGEDPYTNRVVRTFAFIDLSGFTGYTDAEGDAAAVSVLAEFRVRVREICARRGVRIAKWLGDGAMMVSVESESIVQAMVDIGEAMDSANSPLALHAGLASGPVILFEGDDYIGQAVNMAARLCAHARAGEVLATESMFSALAVDATVTPIGPHEIAGFAEQVRLVKLGSSGSPTDGV